MKKLNRRIGLVAFYTLFALFVSGCSNKANVEHNDLAVETQQKVEVPQQEQKEEIVVKEKKKPSYINEVVSIINGKSVSLKSVHFAFDKFKLSDKMRKITKENYSKISPLVVDNDSLKIKLEGNCDEWGTDEYNYALGLKRAKAVKDTLINDGIPANRIMLVTFGESNPLCSDKTQNCWKKNRRTDYKLLP